jgi:hypothetical protein
MSRVEALAALFKERPNVWLDGAGAIAEIAGRYAWRSRISDLRRPPFNMTIANRQRHVRRSDGGAFVVSEYRFVDSYQQDRPGDGGRLPLWT